MRQRFEQQIKIGQYLIEDTQVNLKSRSAFDKLMLALKMIYTNNEYNDRIFHVLEEIIVDGKKKTGRRGMDLWMVFVLAQSRLCLNISYDDLHNLANNHRTMRQIMGIETESTYPRTELEYQNIVDNVNLLDDRTLIKINDIIVEMGHDVFKKKDLEALRLKTDSFVVKSNVHFPTDYNLLYDSGRKCLDIITKLLKESTVAGWRKIEDWQARLKILMRQLAQSQKGGGKNKDERVQDAARNYLSHACQLSKKIKAEKVLLPLETIAQLGLHIELDNYISLLDKHIDLVNRRIIQKQDIPHCEKLFSIFEQYTEWITKGKTNPNVELGKNIQITSDQYGLIVDYSVMEHEVDKTTVITLADRLLFRYNIHSWSFDKGFYTQINKELLTMYVPLVVMPKKGKLNQAEKDEEHATNFVKTRRKHSAVESNINELEHRGLDRCPDRGYGHFKRYISLGVCAYNLHKIGTELRRQAIFLCDKIPKQAA